MDLPKYHDYVWVKRASSADVQLAYFSGGRFQNAESVGDYEGLSVEYYDDVTHWAELKEPNFSEMYAVPVAT